MFLQKRMIITLATMEYSILAAFDESWIINKITLGCKNAQNTGTVEILWV